MALKTKLSILVAIATLAAADAFGQSAGCAIPSVVVERIDGTVEIDESLPSSKLTRPEYGKDSIVMGRTDAPLRIAAEMRRRGDPCLEPGTVIIRAGYVGRVVRIAAEAAADACLKNEILAHELGHVADDDAALDLAAKRLPGELIERLKAISPENAETESIAIARKSIAEFKKELAVERDLAEKRRDTKEESIRMDGVCGGAARRMFR
jgi:hypothetical protein